MTKPLPWLLVVLACILPLSAHAARVALVIGNAAYIEGPLRNPVNDARAMDQKLAALGFNVTRIENLRRQQIGRTVKGFLDALKPGDEVVFFYAGHGVQVKGVNYLPAVDADIQGEDDVPLNSLNVNSLLDRLEDAKVGLKLLFLDACRNNPYARSFRSGERGLARVPGGSSGTLMHFATRPGSVAADGTGANGLYTSMLLRHIDAPDLPVELMLKRVTAAVEAESKGAQEPWTEGSIRGDFYFRRGGAPVPGPAPVVVAAVAPRPAAPSPVLAPLPQPSPAVVAGPAPERVPYSPGLAVQSRSWKLSTLYAKGHPVVQGLEVFVEQLKAGSGGKHQAQVYASASLGNDRDVLSAMQSGAVQAAVMGTAMLSQQVPAFAALDLPLVFDDPSQGFAALDGDAGRRLLAQLDAKGLRGLAFWDQGSRQMTAQRPLRSDQDWAGLKLRVIPNAVNVEWVSALGARATPLPFAELYSALQQGVVDGQDNTLSVISASKLFEVQKHLSLTHHQLGVSTLLVSRTFWNSLSADEQRIATYAAYEATLAQRAAARSQAQADLDTLRRGGMQVHDLTPAERDRLRQRLRPVVDRFSATTDPAVVNDLLSAAARR